jgi:hypothetical protein
MVRDIAHVAGGCRLRPLAHEVLSEGHLCVEAEVEASASASATRGPAASPAAESCGVGVVGAIVAARYSVGDRVGLLRRFS